MIASLLDVGFVDFIIYNLPLVVLLLPVSSLVLYYRFKDDLQGTADLDLEEMKIGNEISNQYQLLKVSAIFFGIMIALFLTPLHNEEAAWFTFLGMLVLAILLSTHNVLISHNTVLPTPQ